MRLKSFITLFSFAFIALAGILGHGNESSATESASARNVTASNQASPRLLNSCELPLENDYLEILESSNDDSILFVSCGGLL